MAEEPRQYKDFKEEFDPRVKAVHGYMAQIRDEHNTAIAEANKAIEYKFEDMKDSSTRELYKQTVLENLQSAKEMVKVQVKDPKLQKELEQALSKALGIITEKELDRVLLSEKDNYRPDTLAAEMKESESNFSRAHYGTLASDYALEADGKKHLIKYMGLEDIVDHQAVTNEYLGHFMSIHGANGEVAKQQVPNRFRKEKSDEEEEMDEAA